MLGKLFKYEFKSTARTMLPIYGALLVMSVINKLFNRPGLGYFGAWSTAAGIAITIYSIIIVTTFVVTFVIMIQRFCKNLLGDEGYLMLTLPVKTSSHITVKLIISTLWIIASILVTVLSVIIITPGGFKALFDVGFANFLDAFKSVVGIRFSIFFVEMAIVGLIELLSSILLIYASISIGHFVQKYRVLVSITAFILLSTIDSKISDLIMNTAFGENAMMNVLNFESVSLGVYQPEIVASAVISIAFGAIFFYITNYVLTKKLNLE